MCLCILCSFSFHFCRRVHITKSTLDYLGDRFEVEPGGGASRESYLADHKVETFLIVPPKVSNRVICVASHHNFKLAVCFDTILTAFENSPLNQAMKISSFCGNSLFILQFL